MTEPQRIDSDEVWGEVAQNMADVIGEAFEREFAPPPRPSMLAFATAFAAGGIVWGVIGFVAGFLAGGL